MQLVEAGIIVNTHGVNGTVKIEPWTDTPEFLRSFQRLYIGERSHRVLHASIHKNHVLVALEGVDTLQEAASLRGKKVSFEKSDANLSEGEYLVADLLGLDAVDDETGVRFGVIGDFLSMPSNGVYVIKPDDSERREILIPAVPDFVRRIDPEGGCVRFKLMEGL